MAKRLGWYRAEQMVLRITLLGSDPDRKIWRRVEVHSGLTLDDLHCVIQNVFEWENSHLYHFLVPPGGKLTQKAMREAKRYHTLPPDPVFDAWDANSGRADEALVGNVFTPQCRQIVYEYDFGDSWEHLVRLEKRTPGGDEKHVPCCLAGDNAAPLDDMGGMWGYYERLDALADKSHVMHAEAVAWLGADFDPARFDIDEVNRRLKMAFRPPPKKKRRPKT